MAVGLFVMFINIQLYKYEPVKGGGQGPPPMATGRVSLDAFDVASDDDLEARLRLSSDDQDSEEESSLVERKGSSKKSLA